MRLRIEQGDCIERLAAMPSDSVDLVLTDPAYESLEKHRARGTTTRLKQSEGSSNVWFKTFPNDRYPALFRELYRVLKPERHAYIICDDETSDIVKIVAQMEGFYLWNTLTWVKTRPSHTEDEPSVDLGMGYHYRRCTERIVFLEKCSAPYVLVPREREQTEPQAGLFGETKVRSVPLLERLLAPRRLKPGKGRQLHDLSIPEVLFFSPVKRGYPTEKPVQLLRTLIEQSTMPGEWVLDPFAGSGSTAAAAVAADRRAYLIELDIEQAGRIRQRFADEEVV